MSLWGSMDCGIYTNVVLFSKKLEIKVLFSSDLFFSSSTLKLNQNCDVYRGSKLTETSSLCCNTIISCFGTFYRSLLHF